MSRLDPPARGREPATRWPAMVAFGLALAALAVVALGSFGAPPGEAGTQDHRRGAVSSSVLSVGQKEVLERSRLTASARAHGHRRLRLAVELRQGRRSSRVTAWRRVRFRSPGTKTVRLRLTASGRRRLRACRRGFLVPRVVVRARRGVRARVGPRSRLRLDGAQCRPRRIASWLPPGRKPAIFDLGERLVQRPRELGKALNTVRSLGADTVRYTLHWRYVAPDETSPWFIREDPESPFYDFSSPDRFIRAAAARGLKVLLTIGGPAPAWGVDDSDPGAGDSRQEVTEPRPWEFGPFALAVARRYSGYFTPTGAAAPLPAPVYWSVWNEPDSDIFLKPQYKGGRPYSPLLYRRLYLAAQSSIRSVQPTARILIGDTSPHGSVPNRPFVRTLFCLTPAARADPACSSGKIDAAGWASHPYTGKDPATGKAMAPWKSPSPCDGCVQVGNLRRLRSALDEAARAGAVRRGFPLFIDEFGYQVVPNTLGVGVSARTQAEWLSISEMIFYSNPRVRSTSQYLLEDDLADSGGYPFTSGLRKPSGAAKPALRAYRLPLVARKGGKHVSLWGLIRPARGATRATIRFRDGSRKPRRLSRVRSSKAGIVRRRVRFKKGRRWQLQWRAGKKLYRGIWTRPYSFKLPPR